MTWEGVGGRVFTRRPLLPVVLVIEVGTRPPNISLYFLWRVRSSSNTLSLLLPIHRVVTVTSHYPVSLASTSPSHCSSSESLYSPIHTGSQRSELNPELPTDPQVVHFYSRLRSRLPFTFLLFSTSSCWTLFLPTLRFRTLVSGIHLLTSVLSGHESRPDKRTVTPRHTSHLPPWSGLLLSFCPNLSSLQFLHPSYLGPVPLPSTTPAEDQSPKITSLDSVWTVASLRFLLSGLTGTGTYGRSIYRRQRSCLRFRKNPIPDTERVET